MINIKNKIRTNSDELWLVTLNKNQTASRFTEMATNDRLGVCDLYDPTKKAYDTIRYKTDPYFRGRYYFHCHRAIVALYITDTIKKDYWNRTIKPPKIAKAIKGWGFVDLKGKLVVPRKYDIADNFDDGYANVNSKEKWSVIDTNGNTILSRISYDPPEHYPDGLFVFHDTTSDKYGLFNKNQKLILAPIYDCIGICINGFIPACKNHKCGILDTNGKIIIPFKYMGIPTI